MNTAIAKLAQAGSATLLSSGTRSDASSTRSDASSTGRGGQQGNFQRQHVRETSDTLQTPRAPLGAASICPKIPSVILWRKIPTPIQVP